MTENKNISGVEAIRQLIKAQKEWLPIKPEKDKVKFLSDVEIEGKLTVTPKPSDGLAYTLNTDGTSYSVKRGTCTDTDIVIASEYEGLPVTSIGDSAFYHYDSLASIIIPDSVTSIGREAFGSCFFLTSIVIPSSVKNIDSYAFMSCGFLTIYCDVESKPEGWASDWNYDNRPVVWGYAPNIPAINKKLGDIDTALNALINITADDAGKVIEIDAVGSIILRTFEESSIKAYIDEYIASALGGDY